MTSDQTTLNVTIRSIEGERFTQLIEAGGHKLIADRSVLMGGSDSGPGPYSFLLTALGA